MRRKRETYRVEVARGGRRKSAKLRESAFSRSSHNKHSARKKTGGSDAFESVLEVVVGDVGVDLGGGDAGVAERLGYQEQVLRAAIKQRGEGMAQAVDAVSDVVLVSAKVSAEV